MAPDSHSPTIEADFRQWRDHGDPDALGRVFDATASSLLLLGAHLTGSEDSAAELVQRTFVVAMEKADRFGDGRPLTPWLAGILRNELHALRRRDARHRTAEQPPIESVDTPERLAEQSELFDAVVAALEEMPNIYKQVLNLRLIHGLSNVEIAQSLGAPVGTVRARAHRGLQALRQALPASLAGAVLLAFENATLAAARAHVLERARTEVIAAPADAASTSTAGATLPAWIHVAAILLASALLWLAFDPLATSTTTSNTQAPTPGSPRQRTVTTDAPGRTMVAEPNRGPTEEEPTRTPAARLTGTIRSSEGPLRGARVEALLARGGKIVEVLGTATSQSEGHYEIQMARLAEIDELTLRTSALHLRASAAGHHPSTAIYVEHLHKSAAAPATARFVADLRLIRGGIATGKVVDAAGKPVSGAMIALFDQAGERLDGFVQVQENHHDHLETKTFTDQHGVFAIGIEPSTDQLLVAATPAGDCASLRLPEVADHRSVEVGTLRLNARDVLLASLRLADGTPAANVTVLVQHADCTEAERKQMFDMTLTMHNSRKAAQVIQGTEPFGVVRNARHQPRWWAERRTDAKGLVRLAGMRPGRYTLTLSDAPGSRQFAIFDKKGKLITCSTPSATYDPGERMPIGSAVAVMTKDDVKRVASYQLRWFETAAKSRPLRKTRPDERIGSRPRCCRLRDRVAARAIQAGVTSCMGGGAGFRLRTRG